ncbi:hypothetical protein M9H77_19093 [Catharanthus roseus]|uniref:Uncharacterized protein n=1 Tax=Catharanthus roseus TaxID=4058 RepID=A0ACC0B9B2_CATRO|nr:hypothetical protein M9H77_19093 [Catharanthus roseus]
MVALVNIPSTFRNVVDNLQEEDCCDPGNLGTLLRSALAFGWFMISLLLLMIQPCSFYLLKTSICLQKVVPKLQLCDS